MADRYFVSTPVEGGRATLEGSEAHHLLHVMRTRVGAELVLLDGSGAELDARVSQVGRSRVELEVLARREVDREAARRLTLGVALPKGDRQRWLAEKLTELGAARLVPLVTERSVARPTGGPLERLRRAVIEASKQSGRTRLMEIGEPLDWETYLASAPPGARRIVAHPGGRQPAGAVLAGDATDVWLAIGPEGGLSEPEIAAAHAANWQTIDLGPLTLRTETAALALASLAIFGSVDN